MKYTHHKLPAFFEFAKDKERSQIENRNDSFVNKLYGIIPNKPINTKGLKLDTIDYRKLMGNVNVRWTKEVADLYNELNPQYRYALNMKDEYINNMRYIACELRRKFTDLGYSEKTITDMLVSYVYGKQIRYKELLWFCFGWYIANNLKRNVVIKETKEIQCIDCGEWVEVGLYSNATRCANCQREYRKLKDRLRKQRKS